MALGGILHYLNEIKAGKSATQNINEWLFNCCPASSLAS